MVTDQPQAVGDTVTEAMTKGLHVGTAAGPVGVAEGVGCNGCGKEIRIVWKAAWGSVVEGKCLVTTEGLGSNNRAV